MRIFMTIVLFCLLLICSTGTAQCNDKIPKNVDELHFEWDEYYGDYFNKNSLHFQNNTFTVERAEYQVIASSLDELASMKADNVRLFREKLLKKYERKIDRKIFRQFINISNYIDFLSLPDYIDRDPQQDHFAKYEYHLVFRSDGKETEKKVNLYCSPASIGDSMTLRLSCIELLIRSIIFTRNDDGTLQFEGAD